ncbi:GATA transcription factor 4-like [Punica granatum]|uniref:GATA-type domain-containing protein n=2 Tax=Punica granatum TaxID=22663 RepID=A0A218WK80_PUNGR|nr:GATA transcription factor 4-like [Punica granatum]OWM73237.1 hypothetical protein CDL15_Pgr001351 [Punica granatum]PKI77333.1 hypothetical protein CRG98_002278 [Punica granatum]
MECGGLTAATTTTLDDLFSQNTEVDVGTEWLSIFVEDCLSGQGSCLPPPMASPRPTTPSPASDPTRPSNMRKPQTALHSFPVAGKARSKRKRIAAAKSKAPSATPWSQSSCPQTLSHFPSSDPLLLDQAYWLADSELIAPKKPAVEATEGEEEAGNERPRRKNKYTAPAPAQQPGEDEEEEEEEGKGVKGGMGMSQPRRCTHCLSQRTPQWRAGPLGPKTLCNACGVRYKSGRLLPEYRPAKSPTFVSYLHSNSHKKVMEMRNGMGMVSVSSIPAHEMEKGCGAD